jgi:hypothetical protein
MGSKSNNDTVGSLKFVTKKGTKIKFVTRAKFQFRVMQTFNS